MVSRARASNDAVIFVQRVGCMGGWLACVASTGCVPFAAATTVERR
ncbi:MAG: hypothetical protein AB7S26_16265 [Sandaracinaceae bacterium]